jgi:ribonuclease-3 family protein
MHWGGGMSADEARLLAPLTLAYLGDAVFELYVRARLVRESAAPAGKLHRQAVRRVRACAQAEAVRRCLSLLTAEEAEVVRRGRNAHPSSPRRSGSADYHYSTGFEALLGYLYLTGRDERLHELMNLAYAAEESLPGTEASRPPSSPEPDRSREDD